MGQAGQYEFFGPPGVIAISLLVPYFSYFFSLGCSEAGCTPRPLNEFFGEGLSKYSTLAGWQSLWDTQAAIAYALWYLFCVVCWFVLPGKWVDGVELRDGKRLKYKMNGELRLLEETPSCADMSHKLSQPLSRPLYCWLEALRPSE